MHNRTPGRFHPTQGEILSDMLRRYSEKVSFRKNKRQAAISRDAWLDESYVSRIVSGERSHPSRDALILLGGWGLELDVHELDELLIAAEYKPLVLPASLR